MADTEKNRTLQTANTVPDKPFSLLQGRNLVFLLLLAGLSALFSGPLYDLLQLSFGYHQHYSHIILIPFVSLYFLFTERHRIFSHPVIKPLRGLALIGLAAVAFVSWWIWFPNLDGNDYLSLMMAVYLLLLWGTFVLVFGSRTSVAAVFPLGFLLFMVPIPTAILQGFINRLLWGSTAVTNWLFSLTGVPFISEGPVFTLPGLQIEIAEVCSGIRSSIALVITGVLAARLFLTAWLSRSLLILALFPLAVFKNGVRIVSLSLLTIYVDEGFMTGGLHRKGGIFFFMLTLAVMGLLMGALMLAESRWKKKH